MKVKVKRLHPEAQIPTYTHQGDACFDLRAATIGNGDDAGMVWPDRPLEIGTGLAFEVPDGHVMLVFSRSGHGFNSGVTLANCVGVVDSNYRGEVRVKLTGRPVVNDAGEVGPNLFVQVGDRVAQAMILPAPMVELVEADQLGETDRGEKGLGSSGVK